MTDLAELTDWLDSIDFSSGWMPARRIVTARGAYVITVQPVEFNGVAVRYDGLPEAAPGVI